MISIRKNCFETNSSSTHALCLDTTSKYPKYTKEQLEEFSDIIYPFSEEEASQFDEPHVFEDIKDKLRYLWTIFIRECLGNTTLEQERFMCKLQTVVPQTAFAYKFPVYGENVWFRDNAAYMEDAGYVVADDDYNTDSIVHWSVDELRELLLNGVIVFGDRDRYDYVLHQSCIDTFIKDNKLKVIEEYTG